MEDGLRWSRRSGECWSRRQTQWLLGGRYSTETGAAARVRSNHIVSSASHDVAINDINSDLPADKQRRRRGGKLGYRLNTELAMTYNNDTGNRQWLSEQQSALCRVHM